MSQSNSIRQTRTYWAVCGALGNGEWYPIKTMLLSEREGQRRLRWLRQWHPKAFLVQMEMTTVADNFSEPPLPQRSSSSPKPQADPIHQLVTPVQIQGLRLVK